MIIQKFYKFYGKRLFDFSLALLILIPLCLIIIPFTIVVFISDFASPFYLAKRVGKNGKNFFLIKIRSMIKNADKSNIISTKKDDKRITKIGSLIRKLKIDEIPQVFNIINGQMSFVGPRPNTYKYGVELYTRKEMRQLLMRPGVTDIASIVFSDEGNILNNKENPDTSYNELIRPWKSKLGILYVEKFSFTLDLSLIFITFINIFNRQLALKLLNKILLNLTNDGELISICRRNQPLTKENPPA